MNVQPFCFENHQVRVVVQNDAPWFVAKDICEVLDIQEPHRAVAALDDDEKGRHTVTTPGGTQDMSIISESGLYSLIFRSRKPEARRFRRWVTREVLPAIRMTGRYVLPGGEADANLPDALPAPQRPTPRLPRSLRAVAMNTALQLLKAVGGGEDELDRLYLKYCGLLAEGGGSDGQTAGAVDALGVHAFLQERCELRPHLVERNDDLYAAYGRFCAAAGRPRGSRECFFREFYALSGGTSFRPRHGKARPRCVKGVGLLR